MLSHLALPLSLTAGVLDARSGRIPNWLTLGGLFGSLLGSVVEGGGQGLLVASLGALFATLSPGVVYWVTQGRGIGGGDVKCWAALGACLGPGLALGAQLWSFTLLVLYALFRAALRGHLWALVVSTARVTARRPLPTEHAFLEVRFGPAIAIGTWLAFGLEHLP